MAVGLGDEATGTTSFKKANTPRVEVEHDVSACHGHPLGVDLFGKPVAMVLPSWSRLKYPLRPRAPDLFDMFKVR